MFVVWSLWLFVATGHDFLQRRIPNWLVLVGVALAGIALLTNAQPFGVGWLDAVAGALAGFGFLLIFYIAGLMGAGDVKFAGALGFWVGLQPLLPIWLGASLLAGLHAVLWLVLRRWPYLPRLAEALSGALPTSTDDTTTKKKRQRHVPFAAYLAITAVAWQVWRIPNV